MKKSTAVVISAALILATSILSTSTAVALNRHVIIVNNSSEVIVKLNGSSVESSSWEENILHGKVIYPGHKMDVNFFDGSHECFFDLRAISANGVSFTYNGMNVCRMESWELTD